VVNSRLTPRIPTMSHDSNASDVKLFALPVLAKYQMSMIHVACPSNCSTLSTKPTNPGRLLIKSCRVSRTGTFSLVDCPLVESVRDGGTKRGRCGVLIFFPDLRATFNTIHSRQSLPLACSVLTICGWLYSILSQSR